MVELICFLMSKDNSLIDSVISLTYLSYRPIILFCGRYSYNIRIRNNICIGTDTRSVITKNIKNLIDYI